MSHRVRVIGVVLGLSGVLLAAPGPAAAPAWVREVLTERYQRSHIEVQSVPVAGEVFGKRSVLLLQAAGIPAQPLRVAQLNGKSPRFHVRDFAPVEVSEEGRLTTGSGSLTLAKGTRLVVLDLTVEGDRVRLFTHTLNPVRASDGKAVYGCTEFVFRFDRAVLDRGDLGTMERRIDEWLPLLGRPS